ncbi:MAG TPA: choice-of-anchor D domain-containing protein [Candidatus Kapabacteria bacterium]|nr:choice-of-anchor D domain-containing protein [Candidatus Kapabacteria bacterium]
MSITKAVLLLIILTLSVCALRAQTGAPLRSAGTDFWLCFPTNNPFPKDPLNPYDHFYPNLYVYITADSTATVQTTMTVLTTYRAWTGTRWGFVPAHDTVITRTDIVQPGSPLTIQVDTVNNLMKAGVVLPYSVHVTSTSPVRVFTLSHRLFSSDGVTAFPVSLCDTSYILAAQKNDPAGYMTYASEAAFIATQDSTIVRILPMAELNPPQSGPSVVITLNRGQVYQIKADTTDPKSDLTGTEVFSNKPIVALSGVERTEIYSTVNASPSRDHIIEQMLPLKYLGRSYLATQTEQGISPNRIKAVAPFDSTLVIINDTTYLLQHQQSIDVGITGPQALYATKPVCVAEVEPSSNSGIGDPFMALVPPLRGYDSSYDMFFPAVVDSASVSDTVTFADSSWWRDTTVSKISGRFIDTATVLDSTFIGGATEYQEQIFTMDTTYLNDSVHIHNMVQTRVYDVSNPIFFDRYMTAIVRNEDVPQFLVDKVHPNANLFKQTQYCDYSVITMDIVKPGEHVASAPHGFWCMFYGYGYTDSYGYIAGLRIVPDDSLLTGSLDFGKLRAKKVKDSATVIQNTGGNPINIIGATIIGKDSASFHIVYDSVPRTLNPGDTQSFGIQFAPKTSGNFSAYLQICTDENIVLIPLTGIGIAAHLVLVPPVTNWGLRVAGGRYDSTVTLMNIGNDSALVTGEDIIGGDTTNFSIRSVDTELRAGSSITLRVNFHPPFTGSFAKTIEAISDSPDSNVRAQLLGMATGRTLLVDSIDYGTRLLGSPDSLYAYIINVSSNLSVRIDSLKVLGQNANEFAIIAPLPNTFPKLLAPGDTQWVFVRFNASVVGPARAFINVYASMPCDVILLTGNVKDVVAPQLASVTMPPICVGTDMDTVIKFMNFGTSALIVSSIQPSDPTIFTVLNEPSFPTVVDPDSSLPITLRVTPHRNAGTASLMVTFYHGSDPARVISSQINTFGLWDSASASSFAPSNVIAVGDTGAYCFMFYNNGNESLTVDSVLFSDNIHFISSATLPVTVTAGDSLCLSYIFLPAHDDTLQTQARVACHALCNLDTGVAMITGIGAAAHAQIDSLDFLTIFSCTQHSGSIVIHNTGKTNGVITAITPADPNAPFTLNVPQLPIQFPADTTITIPVEFSPGNSGNFSTNVLVNYSPRDTSLPPLVANLRGVAQPFPLVAAIDTTYQAQPGNAVTIDMVVSAGLSQLQVHTVRGTISYNPQVLQIVGYNFAGTALAGFITDTFAIDSRAGTIVFHAHSASATIPDDTLLLQITGVALTGDTNKTALTDSVEFPDDAQPCVAITEVAGLFTSDSVCGLSRIDYIGASSLAQNSPNPFSGTADVHFTVGGNDHVTITLYNVLGDVVRTLVDGQYKRGSYSTAIHAENLPAGTYYYRMTAGSYICTRMLTVAK